MNPKDMAKDMALMFYVAGAKETFENIDDKTIEKLAKEISSLSLTIDISQVSDNYKDKDLRIAVARAKDWNDNKPLELVKFTGNQKFSIVVDGKQMKENVSCMQLMGIMAYCVNRAKGNQLEKMQGFDFLKHGLQI